ncbi:hypothetical protein [Verrucomicrobium spinosum]
MAVAGLIILTRRRSNLRR